jgi:hypothetical protein
MTPNLSPMSRISQIHWFGRLPSRWGISQGRTANFQKKLETISASAMTSGKETRAWKNRGEATGINKGWQRIRFGSGPSVNGRIQVTGKRVPESREKPEQEKVEDQSILTRAGRTHPLHCFRSHAWKAMRTLFLRHAFKYRSKT